MNRIDDDQFVQLLVGYQATLYSFIQLLLPQQADTDEVYQETCLVMWQSRESYDASREFLPWCRGVARNQVRRYQRKHARDRIMLCEDTMDELAAFDAALDRDENRAARALTSCLSKLQAAQCVLLDCYYRGRESSKAIATSLGTTTEALHMKLHRLRRTLRECVEKELLEEDQS